MTDPVFKAPTPPAAPELQRAETQTTTVETPVVSEPTETVAPVQNVPSSEAPSQKEQIQARLEEVKGKIEQYFWYSIGAIFLLGLFFGCAMGGGDAQPKEQPQGLRNVIQNPDIKARLAICGQERQASDPCILYILNHTGYDKLAADFFEEAARLTSRQVSQIRFDNVKYANMLIKPGFFAQIQISAKR